MVYNLFLAVRPLKNEVANFSGLAVQQRQDHRLRGHLIKPENLHITLVEYTKVKEPESVVLEKTIAAAQQIDMQSFAVMFDRVVSFKNNDRYPLVLTGGDGAMGLVKLHQALIGALHKQWLKIPPNPRYVPHMTLLYADRMITELAVPPTRMSVQEFVLIRSLAGQGTHVVLGRWALSSPAIVSCE